MSSLATLKVKPSHSSAQPLSSASTTASTANSSSANAYRIKAIRFALSYNPPTIALIYTDAKYAHKQRIKRIYCDFNQPNITATWLLSTLTKQYKAYLAPSLISHSQLIRLLNKLIIAHRANQNSVDLDGLYVDEVNEAEEDLNRVDELTLMKKKAEMNSEFVKRQLKQGDPGYVYDKRVEFNEATEPSNWD